jgi:hypothetical protein
MKTYTQRVSFLRAAAAIAIAASAGVLMMPRVEAQSGVSINFPSVLAAGPDFATDVIGDAWDMSNAEDIAIDPAQKTGWTGLGFAGGRLAGTTAPVPVNGATNGSNIALLERAYWGSINPGRTGAKYPIDSGTYTKLAFKMSSARDDQRPRVYWDHDDLDYPGGIGGGFRFVVGPCDQFLPASAAGDSIFAVDLTEALCDGTPWGSGPVRGFSMFPNSSAIGYQVTFDWVRLTVSDNHPLAALQQITWSGGSGPATIQVIDAASTVLTVATGINGTSYNWNYGILPPGTYTLRITRGSTVGSSTFRINTPPTLKVTDPDATGGEDFATAVLGNPWDMNDAADLRPVAVDHLISRSFSGGQFHGTSDGISIMPSEDLAPVGDPMVYPLANNGVINTSKYRFLTYTMQVDGEFDLWGGSVARVFWGSVPGSAYNVTVSKHVLVWPGMNTYTIDLASLTTAPDGGIVSTEGAVTPWTAAHVRYLRLDPHEFGDVRGFHIDNIKLAAMDETTSNSFTIRFTGSDADGDVATVALYYDTDQNQANGRTLIANGIPLSSGQYTWNTAGIPSGVYYIYAIAGDGRNTFGTYASGPLHVTSPPSNPQMSIDAPANGSSTGQSVHVSGWAADLGSQAGTGVDLVHVYAYPNPGSGQSAIFLGTAAYGQARGDVGAAFGAQFTNSGFSLTSGALPPGPHLIAVYARSSVTGAFQLRTASITVVAAGPVMAIDSPGPNTSLAQPFALSGWAIDSAAPSGPGVDMVHVWAFPNPGSGAPAVWVGSAQYGISRPDVASAYGARFTNSGYHLWVKGLAPGAYQFVVFSHSMATGTFNLTKSVSATVRNAPQMSIDTPTPGAVPRTFSLSGWAVDQAAATGTGVDSVHVWVYPNPGSGAAPIFAGVAYYGGFRPDVGAFFGSPQFNGSGYNMTIGGLWPGTYDIAVFAHSSVSNTFDNRSVVRVVIP